MEEKFKQKLGKNTFESLDTGGLSEEQQKLLKDYMQSAEGKEYYGERAKFMMDFLKHPENFEPTDLAKQSAFVDFVLRKYDGKPITTWPNSIKIDDIDWSRLRNVEVSVVYRYSSTLNKKSVVHILSAEARKDKDSKWERMESGGVAFSLEDWVQSKE